ncbi:MAG: hypothetical protein ACP5VS_03985, partial [Desulfomonilaceae bacterium]
IVLGSISAHAYRVCTFKGTVVDNGWRTMMVKSNGQCAEVNVGWRTKYVPNRRPCIGEVVAVDFILEDGYMKATKVVSLTPSPALAQCYPPAPPAGSVCRTVGEEAGPSPDSCAAPKPIYSTKPPAHVSDRFWSPERKETTPKPTYSTKPSSNVSERSWSSEKKGVTPKRSTTAQPKTSKAEPSSQESATTPALNPEAEPAPAPTPTKKPAARQPRGEKKIITKTSPPEKVKPEVKEEIKAEPSKEEKAVKTIVGEVVASSPKSLSLRNSEEGESAEVVNIRVGLKTKFIPFRRPAVGEKVKVDYRVENGDKFGYTVQVVQ